MDIDKEYKMIEEHLLKKGYTIHFCDYDKTIVNNNLITSINLQIKKVTRECLTTQENK